MPRLTFALAAWILVSATSYASLTPPKNSPTVGTAPAMERTTPLATSVLAKASGRTNNSEFSLTAGTEVLLDGKPCKYADVPSHASIERMELAADNKTVVRIHFRSKK